MLGCGWWREGGGCSVVVVVRGGVGVWMVIGVGVFFFRLKMLEGSIGFGFFVYDESVSERAGRVGRVFLVLAFMQ